MTPNIAFFGGGNMARAIITGLLHQNFSPHHLFIVDRNAEKCDYFNSLGIQASDTFAFFMPIADIVILAVKPQDAQATCMSLREILKRKAPLVISLMAGISCQQLQAWLGQTCTIIRAMPNTPATIQLSITGLFCKSVLSAAQRRSIETIMQAVGRFSWLENETQLDLITALSGSGPAYYFYFIEQMTQAAIHLGLPADIAKKFALETAYGAVSLLHESDKEVSELRRQVTSKKGTTEAALQVMESSGLPAIFQNALTAAFNRAQELAKTE